MIEAECCASFSEELFISFSSDSYKFLNVLLVVAVKLLEKIFNPFNWVIEDFSIDESLSRRKL